MSGARKIRLRKRPAAADHYAAPPHDV